MNEKESPAGQPGKRYKLNRYKSVLKSNKLFVGFSVRVRKLYIYDKNEKRTSTRKTRRLLSKANDFLAFVVDSVDFSTSFRVET